VLLDAMLGTSERKGPNGGSVVHTPNRLPPQGYPQMGISMCQHRHLTNCVKCEGAA
jgi:hypothetical protein